MKVEQKFVLTIKEATFELTKEEAEDLYFSLQSALDKRTISVPLFHKLLQKDYNTPVTCKDFKITTSPNTGDDPTYPFYSTCKDGVNINTSP